MRKRNHSRRPSADTWPSVQLIVTTETDKTGLIRGTLIGPRLQELRRVDGTNRRQVVRTLMRYGFILARAFSRQGIIIDGGDI